MKKVRFGWLVHRNARNQNQKNPLPFLSNGVDEIFTRITHFCRKWNDRRRGNHYGLKNPLFWGIFYFTKFDSENFLCVSQYFFLFPIAKPRNQAFVENLPQNWKWQNLDRWDDRNFWQNHYKIFCIIRKYEKQSMIPIWNFSNQNERA